MTKQDKEDWCICAITFIAAITAIVANFYLHGGRIAW